MVRSTNSNASLRGPRRGWSLLSLIGALSIAAMVLGACVPFYLSSQKLVDRTVAQSRARELARELTSRIRADVRASRLVTISAGGAGVNLSQTAGNVRYHWAGEGLVREVRDAPGNVTEQMVYTSPLRGIRFRREGPSVIATLEFAGPPTGTAKPLSIETHATPRVAP